MSQNVIKAKQDELQGHTRKANKGNNLAPDKTVEHAWEKLIFQVIFRDDRSSKVKPVVFDASTYLDKFKVQFALTYSLEFVRDSFSARNKEMTLEKDAIVFGVESSVYGNKQEIMIKDDIVNDFKEIMIDQLHVIEIPFENEIAQSVLVRLKQGVPVLIEHKKVAVYRNRERSGEVSIEIVGERIDCEKLLKELQVDLDEVKKLCHFQLTFRDDECNVLEALKFEERIKNKYQGVINMDVRPITMDFSTYRDKRKVQDDGRQFLQGVSHEKLNFEQSEYFDCIRSLLFGDDGRLNQAFSKFLNKKMEKEIKQLCPYYVHLGKDNNDIIVICSDKSFAETVCRLVEKIVHMHRGNFESDEAKEFLSREERAGKLKIVYNGSSVTAVVCTNDLSETIRKLMTRSKEVIRIPFLVCQFSKGNGQDIFSRCKEDLELEILVENKQVKIEGPTENVKEWKKRYKNEIKPLLRSVSGVPKLFAEKEKMKMDELMTRMYCSWQYQASNRDVHEQLKNCEYLVTWYNPNTSFKVTAVRGDPKDLAVDNYVMFVSQSLHPVRDQSIDKVSAAALEAISFEKIRDRGKTWNVGDVEQIGQVQGFACRDVTGLIVVDGMNYISVEKLICALEKHFRGNHTCRNILVQAVTCHSSVKMANIIRGIVNTAISYFNTTIRATIKEVFICCTEKTELPVIGCINNSFQQCKGYGRKIHNDVYAAEFEKENEEDCLKVLVCKGSLPEFKADILVNTTSTKLDLSKGMVSAKILEMAGPQIQDECNEKYKDGIQHGEIAVTDSYKMKKASKVKFIFHGALPPFSSSSFEKFLQQFVKRCLYKAEHQSCEKIAFPALGVGKLAYPKRDTARIMFDAVEEFRRERINGKLRKIKFVVYHEENETCEIFASEEWRRSKKCKTDIRKSILLNYSADKFQKICLAEGSSQHIEVLLGQLDEVGNLPSHVIECRFKRGTSFNSRWKPAMVGNYTWNDVWKLDLPSLDARRMKDAVRALVKDCQEFRITEISLNPTLESSLSVGEQVCIFATVLCEYEKKDDRYLQKAYIIVSDSAGMQSVTHQPLIGTKLMLKTPEETKEHGSIEMIGKTKELVDKVQQEVQQLVFEFKKKEMTDLGRQGCPKKQMSQKPDDQNKNEKKGGTGSGVIKKNGASNPIQETAGENKRGGGDAAYGGARPKERSTQPNNNTRPGFDESSAAGFKQNPKQDKTTKSSRSADDSGGNAEEIREDKGDDKKIPSKDKHKRLTEDSTQGLGENSETLSNAKGDESEEEIDMTLSEIGEISAELDQDAIDIIKQNFNWNECCKKWQEKFGVRLKEVGYKMFAITSFEEMVKFENHLEQLLHELRTATVFEVRGLKVKVYDSDITMLDNVDCFGVVAQPTLRNVDGIAMRIAKKLSDGYQKNCDKSVKINGQLSKVECRIIECEETGISVANMYIPHYQETKEKQIELLKYIEKALCNCLIKSNELKKKVLALPFIGSGKLNYRLIHCSQQYVRAIQWFIKDYKHENRALREVHFVGLKEDDVKTVVKTFKDELKVDVSSVDVSRKRENTKQERYRQGSGSEKKSPCEQNKDEHNAGTGPDLNDGKHASDHIEKPGNIHHNGNPAVIGTEYGGARPKTQYSAKTNTHEMITKSSFNELQKVSLKQHETSKPGTKIKNRNHPSDAKDNVFPSKQYPPCQHRDEQYTGIVFDMVNEKLVCDHIQKTEDKHYSENAAVIGVKYGGAKPKTQPSVETSFTYGKNPRPGPDEMPKVRPKQHETSFVSGRIFNMKTQPSNEVDTEYLSKLEYHYVAPTQAGKSEPKFFIRDGHGDERLTDVSTHDSEGNTENKIFVKSKDKISNTKMHFNEIFTEGFPHVCGENTEETKPCESGDNNHNKVGDEFITEFLTQASGANTMKTKTDGSGNNISNKNGHVDERRLEGSTKTSAGSIEKTKANESEGYISNKNNHGAERLTVVFTQTTGENTSHKDGYDHGNFKEVSMQVSGGNTVKTKINESADKISNKDGHGPERLPKVSSKDSGEFTENYVSDKSGYITSNKDGSHTGVTTQSSLGYIEKTKTDGSRDDISNKYRHANKLQRICLVKESVKHIAVLLGRRDELGRLPSHVVECHIRRGTCTSFEMKHKPAKDHPKTWNDILTIELPFLGRTRLINAVKTLVKSCQELKFSEISVNTTLESIELSVGEQVCIFATVLCEIEKRDDRYLQRAYIIVPDNTGMQSINSQTLIAMGLKKSSPE